MHLFYFKHNRHTGMDAIPCRKICFTELTFLLSGSLAYTVDQKSVSLKSGDVLCVREGSTRLRNRCENSDYVSFNFYKEADDPPFALPTHIVGGVTNEIRLLLSACDEIHAQMNDDSDRLTLILQCLLKQLAVNLHTPVLSPLTLQIKNYVAAHLYDRISLESVSKSVLFSPPYCAAVFRRETGKSIIDYAIDEKMKEAKKLIIEGMPLAKVSERLRFDDYNYFSRLFKKRTSCTPSQYQKFTFLNRDI